MYETHFGFHRQPFQCADLSRTFYASESIRRILPQILHTLRSSLGIALVTAPRGAGRTTLLKHLQNQFDQEARTVILPGASLETSSDLQRALLLAALRHAGSPAQSLTADLSHAGRWNVIEQLRRTIEFWGPVIVLVDDCQLVPVSILNELRSFTEEEWNGRGLVRAMVTAPVSFEEELARPVYADFSRRIRCHAFLQPLTTVESVEFLKRHIEAVGAKLPQVLSSDAIELLTMACEGLPRSLALLADETLLGASELGKKPADGASVRSALARLQHLPYHWNIPADPIVDAVDSEYAASTRDSSAIEIVPTISHDAASHSAIVYQSAGVIEFGAPAIDVVLPNEVPQTTPEVTFSQPVCQPGLTEMDLPESHPSEPVIDEPAFFEPELVDAHSESLMSERTLQVNHSLPADEVTSVTTPESSAVEFSNFEVGRRFFAASDEAQSISDAEPGRDRHTSYPGQYSDLESAESFVDLDEEVGSASSFETGLAQPESQSEPRIVTYSHQPVEYYSSGPIEENRTVEEPGTLTGDAAPPAGSDSRSLSSVSLHGFSSRIPVFDRYTWLALGREVPAGRYAVTSSSAVSHTAQKLMTLRTDRQHEQAITIPVTTTTDAEITRWLSGTSTASTEGEFLLTSPLGIVSEDTSLEDPDTVDNASREASPSEYELLQAPTLQFSEHSEDVAVGVESYNTAAAHVETGSARPNSVDDRIASVIEVATAQIPSGYAHSSTFEGLVPVMSDENRLLIRDALRSTLRAELDNVSPSNSELPPPLPATMTSKAWADGSLVFGRKSNPTPHDHAENTAPEDVTVQPKSDPGSADRLFTIPVDLHSIDWDLRSSIMEFPEVAPLAQSVDALRSEVSDFHAAGRTGSGSDANDRVRMDAGSEEDDSLLAKARRRLYTAALADISLPNSLQPPMPSTERSLETAQTTPETAESEARFTTLFTRLRSMRTYRKDSIE